MSTAPLPQSADRLAGLMAMLCAKIVEDLCRQSVLVMLLVRLFGLKAWLDGLSDEFASLLSRAGAASVAQREAEDAAPAAGAEAAGAARRQGKGRAEVGRARADTAAFEADAAESPDCPAAASFGEVAARGQFWRAADIAVLARVGGTRDPPGLLIGRFVFSEHGRSPRRRVHFVAI